MDQRQAFESESFIWGVLLGNIKRGLEYEAEKYIKPIITMVKTGANTRALVTGLG